MLKIYIVYTDNNAILVSELIKNKNHTGFGRIIEICKRINKIISTKKWILLIYFNIFNYLF